MHGIDSGFVKQALHMRKLNVKEELGDARENDAYICPTEAARNATNEGRLV